MPKINQEEYGILKHNLKEDNTHIARDRDGKLRFLEGDIERDMKREEWSDGWGKTSMQADDLFQFIQWEDEEPYSIAELIEEYEKESEETEVKDRLNRETINKILTEYFDETALSDDEAKIIIDYHKFDDETLIELALGIVGLAYGTSGRKVVDILDDFDQLDEPEVLSQGLPVIPKFVADLLEEYKAKEPVMTFYGFIKTVTNLGFKDNHSEEGKFTSWLTNKNEELLMRAWLDGFTVEEEQKYRVLDGNTTLLGRIDGLMLTTVEILEYYPEYAPTFDFTEQEIKDYDPRYWAFAKPVEELEE